MPRVPTYDGGVETRPLATTYIGGAPAAAEGRALQQGAAALGQIGRDQREIFLHERGKADTAALLAAKADITAFQRGLLYGEDGAGGFYSEQGSRSLPAADGVREQYSRRLSDIEGRLNDRLRPAWKQYAQQSATEFSLSVVRHVQRETDRALNQAMVSRLETARDRALDVVDDPGQFGRVFGEVTTDIRTWGAEQGLPGETVERQVDEWVSGTLTLAVGSLIDRDLLDDARALYDANVEEILPTQRAQVERALEPAERAYQAQRAADEAAALVGQPGERPDPEGVIAARGRINAIDDPEIRRRASNELERLLGDLGEAWKAQQTQVIEQEYRRIEASGGAWKPSTAAYQVLDADQRERLRAIAARMSSRQEQPTNHAAVWRLYESRPPDERAEVDVLQLRAFMNDQDFKSLLGRHQKLRDAKHAATDPEQWGNLLTWTQQVNNHAEQLGLDDERKALFVNRATAAASVMRQEKGREQLTDDEIQGLLGRLSTKVTVETPGWWGSTRSEQVLIGAPTPEQQALLDQVAYDPDDDMRARVPYAQIPAEARERLLNIATAGGANPMGARDRTVREVIEEAYATALQIEIAGEMDLPRIRDALAALPEPQPATEENILAMHITLRERDAEEGAALVEPPPLPPPPEPEFSRFSPADNPLLRQRMSEPTVPAGMRGFNEWYHMRAPRAVLNPGGRVGAALLSEARRFVRALKADPESFRDVFAPWYRQGATAATVPGRLIRGPLPWSPDAEATGRPVSRTGLGALPRREEKP